MGVVNMDKMTAEEYRRATVETVVALSKSIGIPRKFIETGAKEEDLKKLVEMAYADVFTLGSPRETSVEDILKIYRKAFS